jgi:hypothetical protein
MKIIPDLLLNHQLGLFITRLRLGPQDVHPRTHPGGYGHLRIRPSVGVGHYRFGLYHLPQCIVQGKGNWLSFGKAVQADVDFAARGIGIG